MLPKKSKTSVPTACIRQQHGYRFTWCGRDAKRDEYLLEDAAYAVKHYTNGTCLRACPDCVTAVSPVISQRANESPLATRGLENNR